MYRPPYVGLGQQQTDRGFMFDYTGQRMEYTGTNKLAKVINRPYMVDDQTFVPFGDPDYPPYVRRDRMFKMLSGNPNETDQEINEKVERSRYLAGMHQTFQPYMLNPSDPLSIDYLGPVLFTGDVRGRAFDPEAPVVPFIEQFFYKYGDFLGATIDNLKAQNMEEDVE